MSQFFILMGMGNGVEKVRAGEAVVCTGAG